MTSQSLIKTGSLVFIKVWPVAQLFLASGRPYGSSKEWGKFEAYGYKEIEHFFCDADGMFVSVPSNKGKFPIYGIILECSDHEIRRRMAKYIVSRFYHILPEGLSSPLWFPESDISMMTKETYEKEQLNL